MVGVRNGVLARTVTTDAAATVLGAVPAGFTWLVKTVHLRNMGPTVQDVFVYMQDKTGTIQAILLEQSIEPQANWTWSGWTSLGPTDELLVAGAAQLHVWVAGADLPGSL